MGDDTSARATAGGCTPRPETVSLLYETLRGWTEYQASGWANLAFLATAVFGLCAAWPRQFLTPFGPEELLENHWNDTPDALRYAIVYSIATTSSPHNGMIQAKKAKALSLALLTFGLEVLAVAALAVEARL